MPAVEPRLRPAIPADAPGVSDCVQAAYRHYITRIGKPPGPMLDDYAQVIRQHQVFVAVLDHAIGGVLVLIHQANQPVLLDNVAVHPDHQGTGLGKRLIALAEHTAREQGYTAIELYTHETMTENLDFYPKFGYRETERRTEKGYRRVYFRKPL